MSFIASCRVCRSDGSSDVRFHPCGCTVHARCVPIGLVATFTPRGIAPVEPNSVVCPLCHTCRISEFQIFPLSLEDLDRSVEVRKREQSMSTVSEQDKIETEAPYLNLLSQAVSLKKYMESDSRRTGRWTNEETAYADFLVSEFDKGYLPITQEVKLVDFLGDILMCKGSRLAKKMKNAKLSLRSYKLMPPRTERPLDYNLLSTLQEKFLGSIGDEASRLEMTFNIKRVWRSHFSDFCHQLGNQMLNAKDWIASLEAMEQRLSEAEESFRKARRRQMGLALKPHARKAKDDTSLELSPLKYPRTIHRPSEALLPAAGKGASEPSFAVDTQFGDYERKMPPLPPAHAAAPLDHFVHSPSSSNNLAQLSADSSSENPVQVDEERIATLLGDYMPLNDLLRSETSLEQQASTNLGSYFVSLRLLLLRPASQRSAEEAELVEIIVKSFRGYSKDNRRKDEEIAILLAKDWQLLLQTHGMR